MRVLCACKIVEVETEDATLVLNGVPCCDTQCLYKAEREQRENPQLELKLEGGTIGKQ